MAEPGNLVVNRYRLLRVIGAGSMGRVWLARDEVLQREVALKEIIAPYWMPDAEQAKLRGHAVREARLAARLSHRHVVAIFDVLHEADRPWIVMEYVPSRSLDVVLAESGPMTPGAAAELGLSLLSALTAAHRAGVLHRDIKPQNVLIGTDGRVALTDFGVAVMTDAATTGTNVVVGTPQYVAPERARRGVSTVATDMWSLGATLYAAVEGRPPYSRDTLMDTLAALADDAPDPMNLAGPIQPAIDGLLHRDPARRAGAADTERRLRAVDAAIRVMSRPATADVAAPTVAQPQVESRRVTRLALLGKARNRIVVGAVGAALVAAVGVSAYASGRQSPETAFEAGLAATPATASCTSTEPSVAEETGPTALPSGWRWYTEPARFQVGVPTGWVRGDDGGAVCFRDPDGVRSLTIAAVGPTADPVGYWRNEERQMTDRDGYQIIGIEPVLYQRGGADWTYTWTSGDGRREQTLRRLFTASTGAGFALTWTTRDYEWALNEPILRVVTTSFTAM